MFMWPEKDDPIELAVFCAVWWGVALSIPGVTLIVLGIALYGWLD